jgi:xanthosine utilization system XapX-like protein
MKAPLLALGSGLICVGILFAGMAQAGPAFTALIIGTIILSVGANDTLGGRR